MINSKHKYGPFKKDVDKYYRVCLKCGKKTQYPVNEEIDIEYNNQRITNYVMDTIIKKDISLILDGNYFLKLVACLMDNISYIYLDTEEQNKLLVSLSELNNYFNNNDVDKFNLMNNTVNYLGDFFNKYNNETKDIYDDDLYEILDDRYAELSDNFDLEIEKILVGEDNTIVEIDNVLDEDSDKININLDEVESESE